MSENKSFLRLLLGFLLSATGVHASCPIELSPPSVVVKYGDPVSVNCRTSASQIEGMGWEATHEGISLVKANNLTWTVNVTAWATTASCYINLLDGPEDQCSVRLKLVVYTFPETINISSSSYDGVMKEMEEYKFTCNIDNIAPVQDLRVVWYKGDTVHYTDTFNNTSKEPVNQPSVLSFIPKREDNGVTFRCEAHLDLGPEGPHLSVSSQEYNITVHFGPDVNCSDPEILEGETLEKHCLVTGNPYPAVRWLKDGQHVNSSTPLRRGDAGLYTVKDEASSFIHKLRVFVLYGPELMCPSSFHALEYAPHNLTCTVEGYPQPDIIWYKDSEEVELPENITRSDAGQYLITASNNLTSVSLTVEINVLYPPSQIVELEDSEVYVGSTMWLKCSSMGNPRPTYIWNYYRTSNVVEENEDGVSLLVINNANAYNMGSYTCHASNDKGNVSKTARVTVKGAKQECPIEITPDRMVIEYQSRGQNATCKAASTDSSNVDGEIHWTVQGVKTDSTSWFADTHKDWDPEPFCYGTFKGIGKCGKRLNFTLYKTPDSVSIHHVENSSSVLEKSEFKLRCDITNVAPAQTLTVLWYRGDEIFETSIQGSMQVTGCLSGNNSDCDISMIRSPLNVSSIITVTLNRTHNGKTFRCVARLDLELDGQQSPPNKTSDPLNITVNYKPTINTTMLPKTIPVFRGYPEDLVCEADGHPPPKIQWLYSLEKKPDKSENKLTVFEAGIYNCSATNDVDTVFYEVEVILKEDYLPLIAGFVAVTVVVISIIFLFIYSIYYKNTRMRRYSLKNPKLSTHNGNVAHNGWDMQFPMTKLS
ncbi:hemicentin-1 [Dicentrarchus labrax]|nr:hemicentin-1 [Dicentrarchus labrax]